MTLDLTPEEAEAVRKLIYSAIRSRTADTNTRLKNGWAVPEASAARLRFLHALILKFDPPPK